MGFLARWCCCALLRAKGWGSCCLQAHPQSPWGKAPEVAVPGHRSPSLWGLAERWQQAGRGMPWEAKATSSTSAMPAAEVGRRQGAVQGWLHCRRVCAEAAPPAEWMLLLHIASLQVINNETNYSGKSDPGLPGTLHHWGVWIASLGKGIPWLKISSVPWGMRKVSSAAHPAGQPSQLILLHPWAINWPKTNRSS